MEALLTDLVHLALLGPLQAELAAVLSPLKGAGPAAEQALACVAKAAPDLAGKLVAEPGAAMQSLVRYWLGLADAQTLLADAIPQCGEALRSAAQLAQAVES